MKKIKELPLKILNSFVCSDGSEELTIIKKENAEKITGEDFKDQIFNFINKKRCKTIGIKFNKEQPVVIDVLRFVPEGVILESLDLSGCSYDKKPLGNREIAYLQYYLYLKKIIFDGLDITDEGLKKYFFGQDRKGVEFLSFANTAIGDPSLKLLKTKCKKLKILNVRNSSLSDEGLADLSLLTRLKKLDISFCGGLSNGGIQRFLEEKSKNRHFKELYLDESQLNDNILGLLAKNKHIKKLIIEGKNESGGGPLSNMAFSNLGLLDLEEITLKTPISKENLKALSDSPTKKVSIFTDYKA